MPIPTNCRLLPALTALAVSACAAPVAPLSASSSGAPRADPLDSKAEVSTFTYRSSLSPAGQSADNRPRNWRDANENVARIGGWRAYAREANAPASSPAPSPAGGEK